MNTQLLQLIEEMEADFSKAKQRMLNSRRTETDSEFKAHYECAKALENHIQKLTKILNEGSVAASEPVLKQCGCWLSTPCDCGE